MRPVEFDQQTTILGKPKDMSDEECAPLPVFQDGERVISCWELNKEDLEEINRTGRIYLNITGRGMPPVWLSPQNPFKPKE